MTKKTATFIPTSLQKVNVAVLVIFFLYVYISAPSLVLFHVSIRNLADTSSFLQLTKTPVSNHLDMISKELQCMPTSKLKIVSKADNKWILQSYTQDGTKKEKGGDEYYVTVNDNNNNSSSPSGIAHIKDNRDGTYALYFVKSRNKKVANMKMAGKGTVTVNLIHTCGIGLLEPPLKNNWTIDMKNGATNAEYKSFEHSMPSMNKPYWPKRYGYQFSQYHMVYAIGDSLMRGIFLKRRENIEYMNVGSSLNTQTTPRFVKQNVLSTKTLSSFTSTITKSRHLAEHKYGNNVKDKKLAVILGSCVWDLLAAQSSSFDNPTESFVMSEHLNATKLLLSFVKKHFPEFDIYWKGCTSVHHQAVDCSDFQDEGCASRVLYMSSRRAKKLDVAQKTIMKEFNVPVLDMFDMSFEMTEFIRDGRHFTEEWYQYMIDYFYPMK